MQLNLTHCELKSKFFYKKKKDFLKMGLSGRLKAIRKLFGYSQREMGGMLSIPQTTYSNYENGTREVPHEVLIELTQHGLDISWLLTGTINNFYLRSLNSYFRCEIEPTIESIAVKLGAPPALLVAMRGGAVSPSTEFFERIFREGLESEPPPPSEFAVNTGFGTSDSPQTELPLEVQVRALREELRVIKEMAGTFHDYALERSKVVEEKDKENAQLLADLRTERSLNRELIQRNELLNEELKSLLKCGRVG